MCVNLDVCCCPSCYSVIVSDSDCLLANFPSCIFCSSFIFSHFFHSTMACTCGPSVTVCACAGSSAVQHTQVSPWHPLSYWHQIQHTCCQLSTAFHTTCNIRSFLTRLTTVSKTVWATKYHISLCCREIHWEFDGVKSLTLTH